MAKFNPPEHFEFFKSEAWPDWKQRFARYRIASQLAEEDDKVQVNALIYSMGAEAEHIFKSFTLKREGDSDTYSVVMDKFNEHFIPKCMVIFERTKFHSWVQLPNESVEAFVRQLCELAENCDFGVQKNEQLRDQIVIRICDRLMSQKLQMKSNLTLRLAIEIARHSDLIKSHETCTRCGRNHDDSEQCPAKAKKMHEVQ